MVWISKPISETSEAIHKSRKVVCLKGAKVPTGAGTGGIVEGKRYWSAGFPAWDRSIAPVHLSDK
jgi:hypothetical protein